MCPFAVTDVGGFSDAQRRSRPQMASPSLAPVATERMYPKTSPWWDELEVANGR